MQLRAENQNLVSALSNYQQILYQFFDFTQNLKQSPTAIFRTPNNSESKLPKFSEVIGWGISDTLPSNRTNQPNGSVNENFSLTNQRKKFLL